MTHPCRVTGLTRRLAIGSFESLQAQGGRPKCSNAVQERRAYPYFADKVVLGSFDQPGDPNEDHRTDERNNNRTNHPSSLPQAEQPENPASQDSPQYAEDDVHKHAVAAALHDLASQPTGNKPDNNPRDNAHRATS